MSVPLSSKVSLILPVFQGGELFLGAIQSIEESAIPFEKIIISFNGSDPADYEAFSALQKDGKLKREYTTYRTLQNLSAAEHGQFALENMLGQFQSGSSIMLLAHDDRILTEADDEAVQREFALAVDPQVVYFPAYHCCQAGFYDQVTHVLERTAAYTSDEFFWLTMRENVPTNMSGMIFPFEAWAEALREVQRNKSGARFEHMLCIAPVVREVLFTNSIKTLIGERPSSDGKQLTNLQQRKAALAYVIAYRRNGHLRHLKRGLPFLNQLMRKYLAYAIASSGERLRRSH